MPLLLQIPYDETGGTHNLISLIPPVTEYTTRYGAEFPEPTQVVAYDATINDNAKAVVRARTEVAHKSKRANRGTYEMARQETAQFILAVVKDMWVRELRDTKTFYTDVAPKSLLVHLQVGCTGCHALDLLALHNEMQQYHLKVGWIPNYINMIEDAQKQAGQAGRTIANKTLLLFVITAMLTTERYPWINDDWEDQSEDQRTWADWKTSYKRLHAKARVKA